MTQQNRPSMKIPMILLYFLLFFSTMETTIVLSAQKPNNQLNVFIQSDHTDYPKFLFKSPDNTILGSVGGHSDVKLWDISSGLLIKTIRIKQDFFVFTAALSPDNKLLATGGGDGILRVWDTETEQLMFQIKDAEKSITSIVFTKKGDRIIYGSEDSRLRLCHIKKRSLVKSRYCFSHPNAIALCPDINNIVVGTFSGELVEYSVKNLDMISIMPTHKNSVTAVSVSPDGSRLLSASMDNTAALWKRGKKQWTRIKKYMAKDVSDSFNLALEGFFSVAFSPDGKTATFAGQDERLWICDSKDGKLKHRYRIKTPIDSIIFTGPETLSVIKSGTKKITDYNTRTGKRSSRFSGKPLPVETIAAAKDYLITTDKDKTIRVWRQPDCSLIRTFKSNHGCNQPFGRTVSLSKNGRKYAVADTNQVSIYDGKTHKKIESFPEKGQWVCSLTFSPDENYLAYLASHDIILWSLKEKRKIFSRLAITYDNKCPLISPDSKTLVFPKSDSEIQFYDLALLKDRQSIKLPANIVSLAFSPDSSLLAAGCSDKTIRILDGKTGEIKRTLTGHTGYSFGDIAWSPKGNKIASSDQSGGFLIWDTTTWTKRHSIRTHFGNVNSLAFSSDGEYIISGGDDGSVRFHNINSFENLITLFGIPDGEWAAISNKGYYNASENGGKYINAGVGIHVGKIDSYAPTYFRPDLLPLILTGKNTRSFKSAAGEKNPPTTKFIDIPSETAKDAITISIKTTDKGGGIGRTVLYLNGSAVKTYKGRGLRAVAKGRSALRKYEIRLIPGLNIIKAVTFNEAGTIEGNPTEARINCTASAAKGTNLYGLVIGIDSYRNPGLNLRYAAKDAALFAKTISDKGKRLFNIIDLKILTSPKETTRQNILTALDQFKNLSPEDLFVFYVAAHGVVDEGEFFLLSSNVGHLSSQKLRKDGLSQNVLKEIVSNIPTTKKMIVLDTCNSQALGNALETAFLTRGLSESTAVKLLGRATGSTILSASKTGQEAIEGYKNHGLFTWTIANGLSGSADMNKDGFVKTTELADYVEENVTELSETVFKKAQFPVVSRSGQSFPITAK